MVLILDRTTVKADVGTNKKRPAPDVPERVRKKGEGNVMDRWDPERWTGRRFDLRTGTA